MLFDVHPTILTARTNDLIHGFHRHALRHRFEIRADHHWRRRGRLRDAQGIPFTENVFASERFLFVVNFHGSSEEDEQIAASNGDKLDCMFRHLSRRGWARRWARKNGKRNSKSISEATTAANKR